MRANGVPCERGMLTRRPRHHRTTHPRASSSGSARRAPCWPARRSSSSRLVGLCLVQRLAHGRRTPATDGNVELSAATPRAPATEHGRSAERRGRAARGGQRRGAGGTRRRWHRRRRAMAATAAHGRQGQAEAHPGAHAAATPPARLPRPRTRAAPPDRAMARPAPAARSHAIKDPSHPGDADRIPRTLTRTLPTATKGKRPRRRR